MPKWRDGARAFALNPAAASAIRQVTLFDRSLVDAVAGLVRLAEHKPSPALAESWLPLLSSHRYAYSVVLAPPWPKLFEAGAVDARRKHSFDAAVAEYDHLRVFFPECGYMVTELPRGTVAERADFLQAMIAAAC